MESPMCLWKSSFPKIAPTLRYLAVYYKMGLFFTLWEAEGLLRWKRIHAPAENETRFPTQVDRWTQCHMRQGDLILIRATFFFWKLGPGVIPMRCSFIQFTWLNDFPFTSFQPHGSLPEVFHSAIMFCVSCSNKCLVLPVPHVIFSSAPNFTCAMASGRFGYSYFEINWNQGESW